MHGMCPGPGRAETAARLAARSAAAAFYGRGKLRPASRPSAAA